VRQESYITHREDPLPPSTAESAETLEAAQTGQPQEVEQKKTATSTEVQEKPKENGEQQTPPPQENNDDKGKGEQTPPRPTEENNDAPADTPQEGERPDNFDPDFWMEGYGLTEEEAKMAPSLEQINSLPKWVHWNLLQKRPLKKTLRLAFQGTEASPAALSELCRFDLENLGLDDQPIRRKAKVLSIVEQAMLNPQVDWKQAATVQLTAKNRYEHIGEKNDYFSVAQAICYRDVTLAHSTDAAAVMMSAPVKLKNTLPEQQPRATQMEILSSHNAEVETMRGVTAFVKTRITTEITDIKKDSLPFDREMLFNAYMVLSTKEMQELITLWNRQWQAIEEYKQSEQHCYLPLEGRSHYVNSEMKYREAVTCLTRYNEIVGEGRQRVLSHCDDARPLYDQPSDDEYDKVLMEMNYINQGLDEGDPFYQETIHFVDAQEWQTKGNAARLVAYSSCETQYCWVRLPTHTPLTLDFHNKQDLLNDGSGNVMTSVMHLLGVRAFNKTAQDGSVNWFLSGFFYRAVGEKKDDGSMRLAECMNVFRTKPLRTKMRIDTAMREATGLRAEELWIGEKGYRRISNNPDDEYMQRDEYFEIRGPAGYVTNMPIHVLRKAMGNPNAFRFVGECEPKPGGDKMAFRCRGCQTEVQPDAACAEYCWYHTENHPFGTIMLKIWTNPERRLPLPELHAREIQQRKLMADRLSLALDQALDVDNAFSLREVAKYNNVPFEMLHRAVAIAKGEAINEDEIPRVTVRDESIQDPCGKCGARGHTGEECNANAEAQAFHARRVLNELRKPLPREPMSTAPLPLGKSWQEAALNKMTEGTMKVAEPPSTGAQTLKAARVTPFSAVVAGSAGPTNRPGYRPARPRSTYGTGFALEKRKAALLEQQHALERGASPNVGKSGWQQNTGSPYQRAIGARPPARGYGQFTAPDLDAQVIGRGANPPAGMPAGWDFVRTRSFTSEPRLRAANIGRTGALGQFHSFPKVNSELSRAVYECSGFMPAALRECVEDDRQRPATAVEGDRLAPLVKSGLGVVGKEEVLKKWPAEKIAAYEAFYSSAAYSDPQRPWCILCLCPGHYASACRRHRNDDSRLECDYCGSGAHTKSACLLIKHNVGCDQCGSMEHGRLKCPYNERTTGDPTCSARVRILSTFAKFLPQFHPKTEDWEAALLGEPLLKAKAGSKRLAELMRVLKILGAAEGYY